MRLLIVEDDPHLRRGLVDLLTLEGFDTIGGRRLTESGKPIDLTATIQKKTFAAPCEPQFSVTFGWPGTV